MHYTQTRRCIILCVYLNVSDQCGKVCQSLTRWEKIKMLGILVGWRAKRQRLPIVPVLNEYQQTVIGGCKVPRKTLCACAIRNYIRWRHYRQNSLHLLYCCKTMLCCPHCPYTQILVPFRSIPSCCINIAVEKCDCRHDWSGPGVARSTASRRTVANGKYDLKCAVHVQIVTICDEGGSLSPPAGPIRGI